MQTFAFDPVWELSLMIDMDYGNDTWDEGFLHDAPIDAPLVPPPDAAVHVPLDVSLVPPPAPLVRLAPLVPPLVPLPSVPPPPQRRIRRPYVKQSVHVLVQSQQDLLKRARQNQNDAHRHRRWLARQYRQEAEEDSKSLTEDDSNPCSICMRGLLMGPHAMTLACGHTFHPSCIRNWYFISRKRLCPLCRR